MLKLVHPTDPILTQEAQKVIFPDSSVARIAPEMMQTMIASKGCGLAAPQVGIPLRLFVWKDGAESGVVINPTILFHSETTIDCQEGCLSFPGRIYRTRRSSTIMCNYFNMDGTRTGLHTIDGFRAIVFQHEYDHLQGRLLPHHGQP